MIDVFTDKMRVYFSNTSSDRDTYNNKKTAISAKIKPGIIGIIDAKKTVRQK